MAKFRLRFSMLNLLLLCTIVALGVTLWNNSKLIMPLRAELRDLRKELGYFRVDEPDKINALEADVVTGKAWRWRLHLPASAGYRLRCQAGVWEDIDLQDKSAWLKSIKGKGGRYSLPSGQFTLNVSLEQYDGNWYIRCAYENELKTTFQIKDTDNWFGELLQHEHFSELNTTRIKQFEADEPVVLLHYRRKKNEDGNEFGAMQKTAGPTPSFIIWISGK